MLVFFVYLVLEGPDSITDFPALPNSTKSTLSGDTIEIPNISAYFSDNFRDFSIPYYSTSYIGKTVFPFKPMRLNYPPEFAFTAIKDQTQSTYLEELTYPMRDSLFINGLEPFTKDGEARFTGATFFEEGGNEYLTKVTLRYYPSSIYVRLIVWLGIGASLVLVDKMVRRIIFNA